MLEGSVANMSKHVEATAHRAWEAQESAELLPLALQVGRIGIFESDLERRRTRFSPELCAILRLPVGTEMTYEQASQLVDERDREAVKASIEAANESPDRGRWSCVHRVVRADGAIRWISTHGRRIYRNTTEGLRPTRSIGTVIDVTQLKETEAALRESERRLRFALDAAGMGTFEADITGSVARIDEQEARLLGLPEDTRVVSADELRKRIPLEDLHTSDVKKERLREHREAYHHEFRIRMPDGSERWLSAYADLRYNGIFGVNLDVTQRKRAEAALRDSEARLRVATSGAALGVFEWDPKSDRAVWENERIYEIFGHTRADGPISKQRFVAEYLHPADARDFEAALAAAMRTGGSFHSVCRIRRKDGERRWLQIDGTFEAPGVDKPGRLVGVVADVTARKRMAARAEKLSERLMTVQEKERHKIAQELHDSTVQHLVGASLMLMSLRSKTQLESDERQRWDDLESCLGEAMKELRTFSYLMHPPALRAQGLHHSLRQYIDDFANRSGLVITLRSNSRVDKLPLRIQRSVLRIVQEALANVYRHASATRAAVEIRRLGQRLHLIVSDDGCGVDAPSKGEGRLQLRPGVGIRGIRMRLNQLGGHLRIDRSPAGGTRIHAVLSVGDGPAPLSGTSRGSGRRRH
jgi:PAS domain S-box-containing protein